MGKVRLVLPDALSTQIALEIAQWRDDRIAEGWTADNYITKATTAAGLTSELAGLSTVDHLFLVGNLPIPMSTWSPDGHPDRPIPNITALLPGVATGWLMYELITGINPIAEYKRYFARRHAWSMHNQPHYPTTCRFVDHLDYDDYIVAGNQAVSELTDFGSALTHIGPHITPSLIDINAVWDGEIQKQIPALISLWFSGGDWVGPKLYYEFDYTTLLAYPPVSPFVGLFGSYTVDENWQNNLQRCLLVGDDVLVSVYDRWGYFRWSSLTAGKTIGQAALDTEVSQFQMFTPSDIAGDPTMALDFLSMIVALTDRVAKLETNSTSQGQQGSPNPPPNPVPVGPAVTNGSFATPILTQGTFRYTPVVDGWTFNSGSALATVGSPWGIPVPSPTPQVAVLQGLGSIAVSIPNLTIGQTYTISGSMARRLSPAIPGPQTCNVTLDGAPLTALVPTTAWTNFSFTFIATTTTHTLKYSGTANGDSSMFLSNISIA